MTRLDLSSGIPLYIQLKELIQREIENENLPPNSLAPSENTLVTQYGISRSTVRLAYQHLVDEGFLIRVRGKGTFVAPRQKREALLKNKGSRLIALLMRDVEGGVLPGLTQSVATRAFDLGFSTTVCNSGHSLERALQLIDNSAAQAAAGVIFRPLTTNPFDEVNLRICEQIESHGLPFVFIDVPVPGIEAPCARSDNSHGGWLVGEYLKELGHCDVVAVLGCTNKSTEDRTTSMFEALGKEADIVRYYPDVDGDLERKLMKRLKLDPHPTAVFALDDLIAHSVFILFEKHGIKVPDDISLVGFDDLMFSELLVPPLTTVRQSLEEMGKAAVNLLLDLIRDPSTRQRELAIPVQLIKRKSVKNLNVKHLNAPSNGFGKEVRGKRKRS